MMFCAVDITGLVKQLDLLISWVRYIDL